MPRVGRDRHTLVWRLGCLCAWLVYSGPLAAADSAPAAPPTILLTGFQPFGEHRRPNPSWEAIKSLEGRDWQGYRLTCLELPVDWGAPREVLGRWLQTHQPVAVFSFGQGRPDRFAIEDLARNWRGNLEDNRGLRPTERAIATDGPSEFRASADTRALLHRLAERGYPVEISANAGAYLCEELLYTLEYLRSRGEIPGDVLFCHVPPLGTTVLDRRVEVTPEYVQQFVFDVLEAWRTERLARSHEAEAAAPHTVAQNSTPPATTTPQTSRGGARNPREAAVDKHLRNYFETWSNKEMDAYGRCFHPAATIHMLDPGGKLTQFEKGPFVDWQRQVQQRATTPMVEVPVSIKINFEQDVARAEVFWRLTQGDRIETGYDHFTLIRQGERWLIVHLLFYASK